MRKLTITLATFILFTLSLLSLEGCTTTPVTGDKAFVLFSQEQEKEMGHKAYEQIVQKEEIVTGTPFSESVKKVGKRIAEVTDQEDYKWEFKTFKSETPNAFALPGGKVGIYTGMKKYMVNEAGIATVMSHEIAHAIARHGGQRMSQQLGTQVALTLLGATAMSDMDPQTRNLAMGALGLGATVGLLLPYSRHHESEADTIGLVLMARAGYDPREAVEFWQRFSKASEGKQPPTFLSTHPATKKRIKNLKENLPKAIKIYESQQNKYGSGGLIR